MMHDWPQTGEIAWQQVLAEDASVYSVQWMTLPVRHAAALAPSSLLERYLTHIRRATLAMVQPVRSETGIEFRLLSLRTSLISFAPPKYGETRDTRSVTLPINGGVLVQPGARNRGEISFIAEQREEGIKVSVRLSNYCPLLLGSAAPGRCRKLFYRLTQASIHKAVTVGFLTGICRELEGSNCRLPVVRVKGVGEEI